MKSEDSCLVTFVDSHSESVVHDFEYHTVESQKRGYYEHSCGALTRLHAKVRTQEALGYGLERKLVFLVWPKVRIYVSYVRF